MTHVPINHVVSGCSPDHVMLCVGAEKGFRTWKMVSALELPKFLARLDDLESAVIDSDALAVQTEVGNP